MFNHYVVDTNSVISFFPNVFNVDRPLSKKAHTIFSIAFNNYESPIKLSIPSIIFIEIFEKWFINEEFSKKFYFEVFVPIKESPNIEIKPLDQEVLIETTNIGGILKNHDLHDKIILASASSLNCRLITCDHKIIEYVNTTHIIPEIIHPFN